MEIIGLDAVFSGLSGVAFFTNNSLKNYGLLTKTVRSSSDPTEKVKRGIELCNALTNILNATPNYTIVALEIPGWHQKSGIKKRYYDKRKRRFVTSIDKSGAGRERVALQSLSLMNGIVIASILLSNGIRIPVYLPVSTIRNVLGVHSKDGVFRYIVGRYNLDDIKDRASDKIKNITDAIAVGEAILRILGKRAGERLRTKYENDIMQAKHKVKEFKSSPFSNILQISDVVVDEFLHTNKRHFLQKNETPGNKNKNFYIGVSASLRNSGIVVMSSDGNMSDVVFQKTFRVKPEKETRVVRDIRGAINLMTTLSTLVRYYNPQNIAFWYHDTHRAGRGLEYKIDMSVIESLYFMYGVLISIATHIDIDLVPVPSSVAYKKVFGRVNVSRKALSNKMPHVTSHQARQAALALEYLLKR